MDRSACDVLLEAATLELHAGLLVMGGYSHSRAREFIFGGFTRSVLHNAQLPVFVCH
jgi:nucleotide-binding universal stress UspA family protein